MLIKTILVVIIICIKTSIVHFRSVKLESNCYFNSIDSSPICTGRYAKLSFLFISFVTCSDTDIVATRLIQAFKGDEGWKGHSSPVIPVMYFYVSLEPFFARKNTLRLNVNLPLTCDLN